MLRSKMGCPPGEMLETLAKRFAISELYVFGRRAREMTVKLQGPPSDPAFPEKDVDIGVEPLPGRLLSVRERVELAIALEDLFMVNRVDLVVISEADPFLAVEIVRGELLYCEDLDEQAENELFLLARAGDLSRYRRERIADIFQKFRDDTIPVALHRSRRTHPWVQEMLRSLRILPLGTFEEFCADSRNLAAAESYLRRALKALLDLGRYILAKGFGIGVTEYNEIDRELARGGVLDTNEAAIMRRLAGYRNRMVHFYHEISSEELYDICSRHIHEV